MGSAVFWVLCLLVDPYGPGGLSADSGTPYTASIKGLANPELQKLLEAVSDTIGLRERPPLTLGLLRRRVERDIPQFLRVLKSQGYYGARVTFALDTEAEPVGVTFQIDAGPLYSIKSVDIQVPEREEPVKVRMPETSAMGLMAGDPARSAEILDAGKRMVRWYRKRGFPFTRMATPRVVVDHGDCSAGVIYGIDPGPWARFGPTTIEGLQSAEEIFIRGKIPWRAGDPYDGTLIDEGRRALIGLGLFSTVRIEEAKALDENGALAITVSVTERRRRSVGAGVSYRTDEGPGANISWEHRNLFHRGERLRIAAEGSGFILSGQGTFKKPDFLRDDQSLSLSLSLADERPDAYSSLSLKSEVFVDRWLTEKTLAGVGIGFKESRVDQLGEEERFSLFSFPLHFDWDTSDDLLDPSRGGRLSFRLVPFYDVSGTDHSFVRARVGYRRYLRLAQKPFLVLAGKVNLGAIGGAGRDDIPADERFYAGGGGSIRGYSYQSVGPLSLGQPVGGRSLLELSVELRLKVTDRLGLVGFLDGGTAFTDRIMDSEENLRWATGLGLRYFTPVGPLRLDVGIPLDRREGVDDAFQVYASLGQAF